MHKKFAVKRAGILTVFSGPEAEENARAFNKVWMGSKLLVETPVGWRQALMK